MKTVGEFLNAGLEFVKDDKCYKNGSSGDECHRHWYEAPKMYRDQVISEFAWLENTGVKPEFMGLIEFTFDREGYEEMHEVRGTSNINWSIVKKWRPSLNQSLSISEHETKESAIHKAWVALKGDLNNVIDDIQGSKDSILKCISGIGSFSIGDYAFCVGNFHNKSVWEYVCATQEFTNYCEKMAAEEKCIDIIGQNGNYGLHYDKTAKQVEVIINNNTPFSIEFAEKGGFSYEFKAVSSDKPIFTQAMADAGELPPVGSIVKVCLADAGFNVDGYDEQFESKICLVAASFINKYGSKMVVISNEFGVHGCYVAKSVKPIDTRTDREKAIDAAMAEWPVADKATLEMAYEFWRVGEKC
jgi:hypothetical protein